MSAGRAGTGWAYGLMFVCFGLTTGAKISYLAGAYVCPLAAGPVAIDRRLGVWPGRLRALLRATVSFRAPPGTTGLAVAPGQMDILGWPSAQSASAAKSTSSAS